MTTTSVSKGIFVAATRQHVGKTSTCLGLLSGLKKRFKRVGFIKPVGQISVYVKEVVEGKIEHFEVDKDVKVAKVLMNLKNLRYGDASPIVIKKGYTKQFLDEEISVQEQEEKIKRAYAKISRENEYTVVEGTGHTAVGSIIGEDNAQVAAHLQLSMILVANGGIGSTFDELALNRRMCQYYDVPIRGIILNKVHPDAMDEVEGYFLKAVKKIWKNANIPLLGVIPDLPQLSYPSMKDYEELFGMKLLNNRNSQLFTHYKNTIVITSGLRTFLMQLASNEYDDVLFVTHCTRSDLVLALLAHAQRYKKLTGQKFRAGVLLAGVRDTEFLEKYLQSMFIETDLPIMLSGLTTYDTMIKLNLFTAKFNSKDAKHGLACALHYEKYIDFDKLITKS